MSQYIEGIHIDRVRHLKDVDIEIGRSENGSPKHLILTGPNGSGKTSLLGSLVADLRSIESWPAHTIRSEDPAMRVRVSGMHGTGSPYKQGTFVVASFPANRATKMDVPSGVKKTQPRLSYAITAAARSEFLNYLYEDPGLKLLFDRDNYRHTIQLSDGREPFDLNQLADGYHAMLSLVTELIFRMEAGAPRVYDLPGIVLIDEVETHLHIELQKKALQAELAEYRALWARRDALVGEDRDHFDDLKARLHDLPKAFSPDLLDRG